MSTEPKYIKSILVCNYSAPSKGVLLRDVRLCLKLSQITSPDIS